MSGGRRVCGDLLDIICKLFVENKNRQGVPVWGSERGSSPIPSQFHSFTGNRGVGAVFGAPRVHSFTVTQEIGGVGGPLRGTDRSRPSQNGPGDEE